MLYTMNDDCNQECKCKLCAISGYCEKSCIACETERLNFGISYCSDFVFSGKKFKDKVANIRKKDKEFVQKMNEKWLEELFRDFCCVD